MDVGEMLFHRMFGGLRVAGTNGLENGLMSHVRDSAAGGGLMDSSLTCSVHVNVNCKIVSSSLLPVACTSSRWNWMSSFIDCVWLRVLSADIVIDEFDWWYDGLVMGWDVRHAKDVMPKRRRSMKDSRAFGPVLQRLTSEETRGVGGRYVPASVRNTFWGVLPSRTDGPIASISSGQRITIDTISHEGLMPDQGSDPVRYFGSRGIGRDELLEDAIAIPACKSRGEHDGSHVVTGPIEVKGAKPGDVLMVSVDRLERRAPYGVISTRHGRGVMVDSELEGDYGALCKVISVDGAAFGQIVPDGTRFHDQALDKTDYPAFPLRPFLGIMGVTPDSDERKCSIPPYAFGGNIDVNDMTEGSTLFLPVQIDGAGFYIGDPHYAQGDGEVALTALEAPLRATVTLTVIPGKIADGLFGVHDRAFACADGKLLALGLHEDLDEALRQSVAYSISLLSSLFHLPKKAIYLYLSAAADFDVSQAVDLVRGIHSRIPLSHFEGPAADDLIGYVMQAVEQGD